MNQDKSLTSSIKTTLYQREKLANKIQFLFPQYYEDLSLDECTATLKYLDTGNEPHSEILVKDDELYKDIQIVDTLPTSGQEEGILYILDTTGYIWTGTEWKIVFEEVSSDVTEVTSRVDDLETAIDEKAPLENPTFTGTVTINGDEVDTKTYAESLVANLVNCASGIVWTDSLLPTTDYKAGQTFRVADAGTYAGHVCVVCDLIIVIADYVAESASDTDFIVVQANIDRVVTSSTTISTVVEIVIFDAVTGKIIKGSGVNINSLNDAIAKAHEHTNNFIQDPIEILSVWRKGLVDKLSYSRNTLK